MWENTSRIIDPVLVDSRLANLGLTRDDLNAALVAGIASTQNITPHNPVTAAGYYRWSETVRGLCDQLVPKGWSAKNVNGLPVVLNKKIAVAISVSSGDAATGLDEVPSTRNPKSGLLDRPVLERQGRLFDAVEVSAPQAVDKQRIPGYTEWILLHTNDSDGNVHSELSRPGSLDGSERVNGWIERIDLGEIDGGSTLVEIEPDAPEPPVVKVSRKAN